MSQSVHEFSSIMTPDSLRKTLQMLHNFYELHTKKNYGYTDINGCQYSGIIDNYASELLLESRKILMDRPSLKNFITESTFDYYFDIQYSNLISTYNQQNMVMAVLNKDVLSSNNEYKIVFNNCSPCNILRAESWSDPTVYKDMMYHTITPPILYITNKTTNEITQKTLYINDGTDNDVDYYFYINKTTEFIVDTYKNLTLTTKPITDKMCGLPFVWACISIFNLLPDLKAVNNLDYDNRELLTTGTNGHDISMLYPLTYGKNNLPINEDVSDKWYLKVIPRDGEAFITGSNNNIENNYRVSISKIHYIKANSISSEPISDTEVSFDEEFIKIMLLNSNSDNIIWHFKSPVSGDYDYDGETYINPSYAYIELNKFVNNIENDKSMIPAFVIKFNDIYLNNYEMIDLNTSSGIHIDTSTEYSNNGIDKKNGMVHGLGDFDGLPPYFSKLADRNVHRSHIEVYTIRDQINNRNQKNMDKQTAALLIDSAMPRKDITEMLDSMPNVIKYKYPPIVPAPYSDEKAGIYYTDPNVQITSKLNQGSEIVYVNDNEFGNINIKKNKLSPRFVYHGKRFFSLNMIELDPELEMARVYYLSNDDAKYENNDLTTFTKPKRTLCRICDIPTSFVNLINIINTSPTLVIDENYVRMLADMTEYDKNLMLNTRAKRIVVMDNTNNDYMSTKFIFDYTDNLDTLITPDILSNNYHSKYNLNASLNLETIEEYHFNITNGGTGYVVGDTFSSILGGKTYKGTVTAIDLGVITEISIDVNENNSLINVGNLSGISTSMKTTTTKGAGSGLLLSLTITSDEWSALQIKVNGEFDDIIALKYDVFGNIYVYRHISNSWKSVYQLTGERIIANYYDMTDNRIYRTLSATFVSNLIQMHKLIAESTFINQSDKMYTDRYVRRTSISKTIPIDTHEDLSSSLTGFNLQNSYLVLQAVTNDETATCHNVLSVTRESFKNINDSNIVLNRFMPNRNNVILNAYYGKSNYLLMSNDQMTQPNAYVYDPMKDSIENLKRLTMNDYYYIDKYNISFRKLFYPDGLSKDTVNPIIDPETNILQTNIYSFNEYDISNTFDTFITSIESMDRVTLVNLTKSKYGIYCDPIKYENTELAYTASELRNYLKVNFNNWIPYARNPVKLMRTAGEDIDAVSVDKQTQPTGAYVSVTNDIHCANLHNAAKYTVANIVYVFRIDDFPSTESLTADYCIYDELGNDISQNSMIIINGLYKYIKTTKNGWALVKA